MAISRVEFDKFTVFKKLDISFSPGINIFIGGNGTGKTHILKAMYAACDVAGTERDFAEKLANVFLPYDRQLGRLVHRQRGRARGSVTIHRGERRLWASFSTIKSSVRDALVEDTGGWSKEELECAYIPVKEMLSNAPGFLSLYAARDIHFEEIYPDILNRASRPKPRGPIEKNRKELLNLLEERMNGWVEIIDKDMFYLKGREGNLEFTSVEFTLVAEGLRKLALLWLLIQNGTLLKGSVLFWDEPETNLNPSLFGVVIDVLLALQRQGVQIFIATHAYVILKEFQLRRGKNNDILFHAFCRNEKTQSIQHMSTEDYISLEPNLIADTLDDLYNREIDKALNRNGRK